MSPEETEEDSKNTLSQASGKGRQESNFFQSAFDHPNHNCNAYIRVIPYLFKLD